MYVNGCTAGFADCALVHGDGQGQQTPALRRLLLDIAVHYARRVTEAKAELLRAIFHDWDRGRLGTGTERFAPDIRFSAMQPEGQVRATGPAEIQRFMRNFLAEWDLYRIELHELEELPGERFIASATQHGTGKGSGLETTMPAFIAIAFREEQIVQLEFLPGRQDARSALRQTA